MHLHHQLKFIPSALLISWFVLFPVVVLGDSYVFTRTLRSGMHGEDVRELQKFLNTDVEHNIAMYGAGASGSETDYFGDATKKALIKFQEKYRDEVLTPIGIASGTGIFGVMTRKKISAIFALTNSNQKTKQNESPVVSEAKVSDQTTGFGIPVRLIIPQISIDAVIEHVGMTPDGEMAVPKGPVNTAWFELGPRPGESGSAVISGHFGWKNGIVAVFDNLHKLKIGDKVYSVDEKGNTSVFVVREIRSYDQNADATDVFASTDGLAHLNLVTCEGTWNKIEKSYSNRLVVFADKEQA